MIKKLLILLVGFFMASAVFAEVPRVLTYSGKITDKQGNLLPDGKYNMRFSLWTAATGGTEVWYEQHSSGIPDNSVQVRAGGYNVTLGEIVGTLPDFSQNLWLQTEVVINSVTETFGRRAFNSVAYARRAEAANSVADGCVSTNKLANAAVTGGKIADAAVTQAKAPFAPIINGGISSPKINFGYNATAANGHCIVYFASPFSGTQSVTATVTSGSGELYARKIIVTNCTTTSFEAITFDYGSTDTPGGPIAFYWIAVGN